MISNDEFPSYFNEKLNGIKSIQDKKQQKIQLVELEQELYARNLVPYDIKKYLALIQENKDTVTQKTFSFKKSKKKEIAVEQVIEQKTQKVEKDWTRNETLHLTDQKVILERIDTCLIQTQNNNLYIQQALKSIIVSTSQDSCLLHSLKDCILFVRARQLRIHDSVNVTVYSNVNSGPIIEDCSSMRFGLWDCEGTEDNQWNNVQDFCWLKQSKSPNFEYVEQGDLDLVLASGLGNL
jgi:hypothetical protein